ncbi:MAG TPA: S-adenosylmethionine:tRNA ribosyltransferase-isomerase [Pseudonocardiaceae bacterium]|nr:S-adenosylmethionine:tRNA ribosyltransferase-isomerase [Pseudonocardiaceae bacterium]
MLATPVNAATLDFTLPAELEARKPAEARGIARDGVRLLVSREASGEISHQVFRELPRLLEPGDLVVVNNSATLPAALDARLGSTRLVLHVSTRLDDGRWVVEPRQPIPGGSTAPFTADNSPVRAGLRLAVPDGEVVVRGRYSSRLWVAEFAVQGAVPDYLLRHGRPIRYSYTDHDWPLSVYQNVFSTEPGSAEMPSAGRPFTGEVLSALAASGITVAPITLHTGVASPEAHEKPYPEWFSVSASTASLVAHTKAQGGRVIAIGTTVVRALESAAEPTGLVRAASGWTNLVITPSRGVRAVDGLLTGFHEPRASHLLMLAAISGVETLGRGYAAALDEGYLWHEFGDVHLLLP